MKVYLVYFDELALFSDQSEMQVHKVFLSKENADEYVRKTIEEMRNRGESYHDQYAIYYVIEMEAEA